MPLTQSVPIVPHDTTIMLLFCHSVDIRSINMQTMPDYSINFHLSAAKNRFVRYVGNKNLGHDFDAKYIDRLSIS